MQRIRTRIIVTFLVVALLPALPLSFLAGSLLVRTLDLARAPEIESALEAAMESEKDALAAEKLEFERTARSWRGQSPVPPGFTAVAFASDDGTILFPPDSTAATARRIAADPAFAPLREGKGASAPERISTGGAEYLAMALTLEGRRVVLARPLAPERVRRAETVQTALRFLRTAERSRTALLRSLIVPFILVYALLLAIAAGVGALLAGRIARPVEALVDATRRVTAGDLDTRVEVRSEGETRVLVESFNEMTGKLRDQRIEIERLARLAAWRDIARAVAHELKNPLTPIHLAVQQTVDVYRGDDPEYRLVLHECASIVDEEVRRLRDLVREFSEFARFPVPHPQWGDLADTLGDIARLYGGKAVFDAPAAPVRACYDEAQIRRAVVNLVDNGLAACRAAGRPEEVRIRLEEARGDAIVRIKDRGAGIDPEHLPRIFEPDFSTRKEGMGLGLAIVEAVVRGHGGRVDVESRSGEGTTMTLVIPAREPSAEEER